MRRVSVSLPIKWFMLPFCWHRESFMSKTHVYTQWSGSGEQKLNVKQRLWKRLTSNSIKIRNHWPYVCRPTKMRMTSTTIKTTTTTTTTNSTAAPIDYQTYLRQVEYLPVFLSKMIAVLSAVSLSPSPSSSSSSVPFYHHIIYPSTRFPVYQ